MSHVVQLQACPPRLNSRKSFLHSVDPLEEKFTTWREEEWKRKLQKLPSSTHSNTKPNESLPRGSKLEWKMQCCLNRLRFAVGRKTELNKWNFTDPSTSVIFKNGVENDTNQHWITCSLLDRPCSNADFCEFNMRAILCMGLWQTS